jgi:hypothetical protein
MDWFHAGLTLLKALMDKEFAVKHGSLMSVSGDRDLPVFQMILRRGADQWFATARIRHCLRNTFVIPA